MNLFGMGPMEILVIMIVALVIFGPGRLPEIGAQAGKAVRDFRKATTDLTSEFQDSIDDVQSTVGEMKATVTDMQRETQALAKTIPAAIEGTPRPAGARTPFAATSSSGALDELANVSGTAADSAISVEPEDTFADERPAMPVVEATRDDPYADLAAFEDDDAPVEQQKPVRLAQ